MPPRIAANDKGNNNLPGLTTVFFLTTEIKVATTAVLLINAELKAVKLRVLKLAVVDLPLSINAEIRLIILVRS